MRAALRMGVPDFTPPFWLLMLAAKAGDMIAVVVRRRIPLDSQSLSKLADSAAYSSEKIGRMLGYRAEWPLERALEKMVRGLKAKASSVRPMESVVGTNAGE